MQNLDGDTREVALRHIHQVAGKGSVRKINLTGAAGTSKVNVPPDKCSGIGIESRWLADDEDIIAEVRRSRGGREIVLPR